MGAVCLHGGRDQLNIQEEVDYIPQLSLLIYLTALTEQYPGSHVPKRGLPYFYNLLPFL